MREAGVAALAMTEAGGAAPATTGAGGAPHPLLAVATPPPLTGTHYLTISRCQPATVFMHSSSDDLSLHWMDKEFALDGLCTCIHYIVMRIC